MPNLMPNLMLENPLLTSSSPTSFCVNLFGLSNKRFSVILNVNYGAEDFPVKPRFNCWLDEKRFYP